MLCYACECAIWNEKYLFSGLPAPWYQAPFILRTMPQETISQNDVLSLCTGDIPLDIFADDEWEEGWVRKVCKVVKVCQGIDGEAWCKRVKMNKDADVSAQATLMSRSNAEHKYIHLKIVNDLNDSLLLDVVVKADVDARTVIETDLLWDTARILAADDVGSLVPSGLCSAVLRSITICLVLGLTAWHFGRI